MPPVAKDMELLTGKRLVIPLARIDLGHKQRNRRVQILVVDPGEEPSEHGDAEAFCLNDDGEFGPPRIEWLEAVVEVGFNVVIQYIV